MREMAHRNAQMGVRMRNGAVLLDTEGKVLHAHGGFMCRKDDWFYWFGENRTGRIRVSCYRSKDLESWEFCNHVLTLDSPVGEHYVHTATSMEKEAPNRDKKYELTGCNIERPKVIYNAKTRKYVMWMHYENGADYNEAKCAVAVCDTIDGDYTYLGCFNPVGNMSRDCTLFVDDDATAYFISAGRGNADTIIYRLSEDYLAIDEQVKVLWPGQYREAASVCKRNGIYYMFTSHCTGWAPNQGKYAWATELTGRWSFLEKLGDETTYRSQPAFILPVMGKEGQEYLYVGDRWCAENYDDSTYVFYPLSFEDKKDEQGREEHLVTLNYCEEIDLSQYS